MRRLLVAGLLLALTAQPARELAACCGNRGGPFTAPTGPTGGGGCDTDKTQGDEHPACDPCQVTGSPNFLMSGNYRYDQSDLSISGPGPAISAYRVYNAHDSWIGPIGRGWHHSLILQAVKMRDDVGYYVLIRLPSADRVLYTKNGSTYTGPQGHDETMIENPDGSLTVTYTDGTVWQFRHDGWIDFIQDRYGNSIAWTYAEVNGQNRPVEVQGAAGRKVTIAWNASGRIDSLTDHTGRRVSYTYDEENNLSGVVDVAGRTWTYTYELLGKLAMLTSIEHMGLRYASASFDSAGRLIAYSEQGAQWTIEYLSDRTRKRDAGGNLWEYFYDSEGKITMIVDPLGNTSEKAFDANGRIQMTTDQTSVKTYYTYNPNGTTASVTKDYQGSLAVRYEYTYDASFPEKVSSIIPVDPATDQRDPDWQGTQYEYWQAGDPAPGALKRIYTIRSDGTSDLVATYEYDSHGKMTKITDASGTETTYGYDAQTGELTTVTMPPNSDSGGTRTQTYTRDDLGRLTSTTDPAGRATTYTYEALGRIATVTLPDPTPGSPLDFTTRYSYDNLESGILYTNQTDANGNATRHGFDQFGRLVRSVDALGNATKFDYADGHLVSVTDANDNVTTYTYDAARRLSATLFPDGAIETYTYWPDGQLKTKTNRKGQTITYSNDAFKRMIEKAYPNATSIRYIYEGQKLVRVDDGYAGETHTFQHDTAYRMVQETQGPRGTLSYSYQPDGRLDGYAVAGGTSATYDYYPDGSLKNIQWSPVVGYFTYTYTPAGQYNRITFPNGQYRQFDYDDQGRLLQLANIHPTSGNLATFAYGYDINHYTGAYTMLGQRTSMTMDFSAANQINALHKYYYDSSYQLTRVDYPTGAPFNAEVHEWTYDAVGNRLTNTVDGVTQTYTYYKNRTNPKNSHRLQSDGVNTYTFDANGNTITKTGPAASLTFAWDYDDRLISVGGAEIATYSHDFMGRRTQRDLGSGTTQSIYRGLDLVAELSGTNAHYAFGPSIDQPLGGTKGGLVWYATADALGSVASTNDSAGQLLNQYLYDSWGAIQHLSAEHDQPFGYTAREFAEADMWFYRRRHYDSLLGRFASPDRLSHRHVYAYVLSDPVSLVDPSGNVETQVVNQGVKPLVTYESTYTEDQYGNANYHCAWTTGDFEPECKCKRCGARYQPRVKITLTIATYMYVGPKRMWLLDVGNSMDWYILLHEAGHAVMMMRALDGMAAMMGLVEMMTWPTNEACQLDCRNIFWNLLQAYTVAARGNNMWYEFTAQCEPLR